MSEYWINSNGVDRKMTPEEIEMYKEMQSLAPPPQPSETERIAELEQELKAAKILLGLEA